MRTSWLIGIDGKNFAKSIINLINKNEPGMIGQIADKIADEGYNIEDMSNKSRDAIAINLIDVDKPVDQTSVDALSQIDHVLVVRSINH